MNKNYRSNDDKEARLIMNAGVARRILKLGGTIVDIKPDKNNRDKTVHAFKNDDVFKAAFEQVNKEIAEFRSKSEAL